MNQVAKIMHNEKFKGFRKSTVVLIKIALAETINSGDSPNAPSHISHPKNNQVDRA